MRKSIPFFKDSLFRMQRIVLLTCKKFIVIVQLEGGRANAVTFHRKKFFNPLKPELNPISYLLALLGAYHFLHVSRIRVKLLTLR